MLTVRYLTPEDVAEFHPAGRSGLRSDGDLLESVYEPARSFGDEDLYTTFAQKTAAYFWGIVKLRPFRDMNVSMAWLTALAFLDLNLPDPTNALDRAASVSAEKITGLARLIAVDDFDVDAVAEWFEVELQLPTYPISGAC